MKNIDRMGWSLFKDMDDISFGVGQEMNDYSILFTNGQLTDGNLAPLTRTWFPYGFREASILISAIKHQDNHLITFNDFDSQTTPITKLLCS